MTNTDPRTILDEIKARADDCRSYSFGMRNADRLAHEDAPAMAAALTAALDLYKHVTYPDEGDDPYLTGRADGYELAMARVHREIKHALGGGRG